jgi:hypothetical protein
VARGKRIQRALVKAMCRFMEKAQAIADLLVNISPESTGEKQPPVPVPDDSEHRNSG